MNFYLRTAQQGKWFAAIAEDPNFCQPLKT